MNRGLQVYNEQQKISEWAEKVQQCRSSGLSVREWCQENRINISSYYKWQRKIYSLVEAEEKPQSQVSEFVDVTPSMGMYETASVAITVHTNGVAADIRNGADPATVEAVLRLLKLC